MKKCLLFLIIPIFLFSCNQEELKYSCDPEINAIVKSATVEFSQLSLNEFLEYDLELQRAIYRSFTPEKMRAFWLEKLEAVKSVNSYTQEEFEHIQELINQIDEDYFDSSKISPEDLEDRLNYFKQWSDYAATTFEWSKNHYRYILYSLTITEEQYDITKAENRENSLLSLNGNCDCKSEADCDEVQVECHNDSCSATSIGCGPLWLSSCTGICY